VSLNGLKLISDAHDEFTASISREIAANVKETRASLGSRGTLTKPADQKPLRAQRTDGERILDVAEAFALKDLMDRGFTYDEAVSTIDEIGVEGVDDVIESGDIFAHEMLPLGGFD